MVRGQGYSISRMYGTIQEVSFKRSLPGLKVHICRACKSHLDDFGQSFQVWAVLLAVHQHPHA